MGSCWKRRSESPPSSQRKCRIFRHTQILRHPKILRHRQIFRHPPNSPSSSEFSVIPAQAGTRACCGCTYPEPGFCLRGNDGEKPRAKCRSDTASTVITTRTTPETSYVSRMHHNSSPHSRQHDLRRRRDRARGGQMEEPAQVVRPICIRPFRFNEERIMSAVGDPSSLGAAARIDIALQALEGRVASLKRTAEFLGRDPASLSELPTRYRRR